ncbi:MAG: VOC family protein [Pseudomonadota bacterium]
MTLALDHVGFIVPDLAATSALLEALGFSLSARAEHTRTLPTGEVVPAGSAQRSLMLDEGYIEFMEIFDPSAGHMLAQAGSDRHGLHILALGTTHAQATHAACTATGVPVGPVMDWRRAVDEAGVRGLASFRFFGAADWHPADPSYLCWVQHLTPELLRPAHLLRHANAAQALVGLAYEGDAAWARRLRDAGAPASVTFSPGPGPARATALTLRFAALDAVIGAARRCGIAVTPEPGGAWLDLRAALGLRWRCVAA